MSQRKSNFETELLVVATIAIFVFFLFNGSKCTEIVQRSTTAPWAE